MGPTVSGIADRVELGLLRADLPLLVERIGLPYPARSVRYRASREEGIRALGRLMEDLVEREPDVRLVVIGLSQGADVVRSACSQGTMPPTVEPRISALVLLGDPGRDPRLAETYQHGTSDATPGLLAMGASPLPRSLWSRAWGHCLEGDRVCAARLGRLGAAISGSHTRYGENADDVLDRAAAFVVDRLLDRDRPGTGGE